MNGIDCSSGGSASILNLAVLELVTPVIFSADSTFRFMFTSGCNAVVGHRDRNVVVTSLHYSVHNASSSVHSRASVGAALLLLLINFAPETVAGATGTVALHCT